MSQQAVLPVFIPGKLVNPLNRRRGWRAVWASSRDWRTRTVSYVLLSWGIEPDPQAPKRITFDAHVWRLFDDDGLQAALKPVRDALGPRRIKGPHALPGASVIHSDAPDSGHVFMYRQHVDRQHPGVTVTVERLHDAEMKRRKR